MCQRFTFTKSNTFYLEHNCLLVFIPLSQNISINVFYKGPLLRGVDNTLTEFDVKAVIDTCRVD